MASKQKTDPASTPTIVRRPRRAKRTEEEIRAAEDAKRRERQMKAAAKRRAQELKREAAEDRRRRRITGNYIRLPLAVPIGVLRDRANAVRFAGGDAVPVPNAFRSGEQTAIDPLTAHHMVAGPEMIDFVDPGLTAGKADWDIYDGDCSSPEKWLDEEGEALSAPAAPIEEMGIEDRLAMWMADRVDEAIYAALNGKPWGQRLFVDDEETQTESVQVRPVLRIKPFKGEDPLRPRCDEHRKRQKLGRTRQPALAGKREWIDSPPAK